MEGILEKAVKILSRLPGFGQRSARRSLLYLLKNKEIITSIIVILKEVLETTKICNICHNITTSEVCDICLDEKRDKTKLCIVAEVDDIWSLEKSTIYKGVYHSLGGNLSATSGITPEKLNLITLFKRLKEGVIEEVIFANNLSPEGATTAFYIIEEIKTMQKNNTLKQGLKITELANGIPLGASLEYMDDGTIRASFDSRKPMI